MAKKQQRIQIIADGQTYTVTRAQFKRLVACHLVTQRTILGRDGQPDRLSPYVATKNPGVTLITHGRYISLSYAGHEVSIKTNIRVMLERAVFAHAGRRCIPDGSQQYVKEALAEIDATSQTAAERWTRNQAFWQFVARWLDRDEHGI